MKSPRRAGRRAALVFAALVAGCSPIRILNGLVPDAHQFESGIAYGNQPRQQLDVYQPSTGKLPGEGRAPLVVFFYGGSWSSGQRADYKFVGEALATRGAVVVIPDYRLSPQVTYPTFLRDGAQALRWGLDNAARLGADPKRVYVMGHSAGAYIAAMLALDDRWLREAGARPQQLAGWIGMAGPYDFLPIVARSLKPVFHFPDTPPDSQPIAHVTPNAPPALLMVGMADTTVDPHRNTEGLAAALQAARVPVTLVRYDGLGHALLAGALARPLRWRAPVLDDLAGFVLDPSDAQRRSDK